MENDAHPADPFVGKITFIVPSKLDFERITGRRNYTQLWSSESTPLTESGTHGYRLSASDSVGGRHQSAEEFHQIVNYLWITTILTLLVTSVIFLIFSIYFYRKFMEWKRCNKDIQAQMAYNQAHQTADEYCSTESLPCYTIATGLPTYNEALRMYTTQNENRGYIMMSFKQNHITKQEKHDLKHEALPVSQNIKGVRRNLAIVVRRILNRSPSFMGGLKILVTKRDGGLKSNKLQVMNTLHGKNPSEYLQDDNQLNDVTVLS